MNPAAAKLLFRKKNVIITGGTGSFGRVFARRLLEEDECNKVIIFSRDEWKQWEMSQSDPLFRSPKVRFFLGDVRDKSRLVRAFQDVHYVVHAAALKQVPAAEYNPTECIKTNIIGAMNVIEASLEAGVEKTIALSTDKAVNPVNLYGATKLCSDKLFVAANAYTGSKGYPIFAVARYGNVANSRGSIIPYWKKLIDEGIKELPITDKRMTRFWITLSEAADFVCKSIERMSGGEIFVPKLPSVHIEHLASAVGPKLKHHYTGIRAGEKIHELMIGIDDARHTIDMESYYMIMPETFGVDKEKLKLLADRLGGKLLPDGFAYTSDGNDHWLTVEKLQKQINECRCYD